MIEMKHFLSLANLSSKEMHMLINKGIAIKKNPSKFSNKLKGKTLILLFDEPSLRTRISFEAGMLQLGGHAITYHLSESTVGKKESPKDFSQVLSRYVDIIMARLYSSEMLAEIARNSRVPVINGMTSAEHPCQVLSDLMTICEKRGKLKGLKLAYVGDGLNNTTHSLLYGCSKSGVDVSIGCPKQMMPDSKVLAKAKEFAKIHGSKVHVTASASEAVSGSDIIYTDSWMSYHVPHNQEKSRHKILMPYQVNKQLMKHAPKALFMHCLPAKRGAEVTDGVIDSKASIVYDQAENRLHAQKALMLWLMKK